jgi:hypothetical protein
MSRSFFAPLSNAYHRRLNAAPENGAALRQTSARGDIIGPVRLPLDDVAAFVVLAKYEEIPDVCHTHFAQRVLCRAPRKLSIPGSSMGPRAILSWLWKEAAPRMSGRLPWRVSASEQTIPNISATLT